jgi:hypothetical protein
VSITYNSETNLSIGHVPNVESFEDVYTELLDIHNALEILLNSSDLLSIKLRSIRASTADETITTGDGTILIDASANDVTITLPEPSDGNGYHYRVKCIALGTGFTAKVIGPGTVEIDDDVGGVELELYEAIHVQCDNLNYYMVD